MSFQISDASLLTNGIAFIKKVILFSTCLAKKLTLFKRLPSDVQHILIKTSTIEMCIVLEAAQLDSRNSQDTCLLATNEASVIKEICTQGQAIVNKLLALDLTQSEYSLLCALILFCSGNYVIL